MKGKILSVTIDHVIPFKSLFEGLKDPLTDVNLEFIRPTTTITKKKELIKNNNSDDSDNDNSGSDSEEETKKKVNSKTKKTPAKNTKTTKTTKTTKKKEESDNSDDDQKKKTKAVPKKPIKKISKVQESNDEDDSEDAGDESNTSNKQTTKNTSSTEQQEPSDGGIKIAVLDNSKTLYINVKLDANEFYDFYCKPPTYDIGVNLGLFYKALSILERDDVLTLSINEDDRQNLLFEFKNNEKNKFSYQTVKLIDIDKSTFTIPPVSPDASIIINTSIFHRICRDKSKIAEHLEIKCTRKQVAFSWKGDNIKGTTMYCSDDRDDSGIVIRFTKNSPDIIQGIFDLKYLALFTKFVSLCPDIVLNMKNSFPLIIEYKIASIGRMKLCLTPIVEDNELENFDVSDNEEDDTAEIDDVDKFADN